MHNRELIFTRIPEVLYYGFVFEVHGQATSFAKRAEVNAKSGSNKVCRIIYHESFSLKLKGHSFAAHRLLELAVQNGGRYHVKQYGDGNENCSEGKEIVHKIR